MRSSGRGGSDASELLGWSRLCLELGLVGEECLLSARVELRALVVCSQGSRARSAEPVLRRPKGAGAGRALCETMPRAERLSAQLAVADDAHRRLRAPLGRANPAVAALLGRAALEPQCEADGRAVCDAVCRERFVARCELARAEDEALLGDGDGGAVRESELEVGDGRGLCECEGLGSARSCKGMSRQAHQRGASCPEDRGRRSALCESCDEAGRATIRTNTGGERGRGKVRERDACQQSCSEYSCERSACRRACDLATCATLEGRVLRHDRETRPCGGTRRRGCLAG